MRHGYRRLARLAIEGVALVAIGCGGSSPAAERVPSFTPTGSLGEARADSTATRLSSGRVLLVGGSGGGSAGTTAEVYDPAARTFTAMGGLSSSRVYHVAALLQSGRGLVAGGAIGAIAPGAAEECDPASGNFAVAGDASAGHANATATGLADGSVIVAAGYAGPATTAAVERYHPASMTFAAAGNLLVARASHTATLLPNGKVLIAGGYDPGRIAVNGGILGSAEIYDPALGTFASTATMGTRRAFHAAALLPDGGVLVAGGLKDWSGGAGYLASAEIYR